ncbi:hypothetical protein ACFV5J_00880 [Streptomyces zaomyceticus]|uniref:hypothetical protein n=1 Tax=Streptomyces zaomyceticus TaxID=68286 RepID=UPI00167B6DFA|nr:hypothetical protein [Streptomyces zaomyceticus]
MIRDLIFAEAARVQFGALPGGRKADVGKALLEIAQKADRHGVWRSKDGHRLAVTYEVHPSAVVVTTIGEDRATPPSPRQPYSGMQMRHQGGNRWTHLNPHEE